MCEEKPSADRVADGVVNEETAPPPPPETELEAAARRYREAKAKVAFHEERLDAFQKLRQQELNMYYAAKVERDHAELKVLELAAPDTAPPQAPELALKKAIKR